MSYTALVLLISVSLYLYATSVQLIHEERSRLCSGKFFIMVFLVFIILLSRRTITKLYKNRDGIHKTESSCIIINS